MSFFCRKKLVHFTAGIIRKGRVLVVRVDFLVFTKLRERLIFPFAQVLDLVICRVPNTARIFPSTSNNDIIIAN